MRFLFYIILIAAISCLGAYAQGASDNNLGGFTAGPYLLDVTTDSATVAFHLDKPLAAKVRVFDGNESKEFKSEQPSKSHFIKVTGLRPGLTYDYEVICGDGEIRTPEGDGSFQIRTACRPGESFTFAVYGDTRPSENKTTLHHQEVINQAILHEPLFCLVLGDMVDDGSKLALWNQFFQIESKLLRRSAIYPALGDNDFADGKGLYAEFFPQLAKGYYRFEWGGVQFFCLRAWGTRGNQAREELDADSPQIKWLESELAKEEVQKAPFRVVFMHDPVYISRGRVSEVLSRVWAPLFKKYKVDVVFASWHLYERSANEEITYIISGGAGAELIWMNKDPAYPSQADAREYHFCKVEINSNAMTISAIGTDGTVLDSVTLAPRSHEPEAASRIERAAKRLGREIHIAASADSPPVPVYFFSSDCSFCQELLNYDLPKLANENNIALEILYFDLGAEGTYDLFLNAEAEFGRQGVDIPAIFIGRSVFGGESEIKQNLPAELVKFRNDPQSYLAQMITPFTTTHDTATIKENTFNTLAYSTVIGAGLLDSIKPCASTTVILLILYLSIVGGTRKQMLYIGGIFTAAVFIMYLVIGFAFFNSIRLIFQWQLFAAIVNSALLLAVAVFAISSLVDFIRCLKGTATDTTLEQPGFLTAAVRQKISGLAQNKAAMAGTSFVLGIVIAGTELVCTGQVYFPIVSMISEPRYRAAATTYLFSYNAAFVAPLVAVFLLVAFGVTSERTRNFFKRHIAPVKLALALLFIVMAGMTLFNLRWI